MKTFRDSLFRNYKHCTKCKKRKSIFTILFIDKYNMLCPECQGLDKKTIEIINKLWEYDEEVV